MSNFNDDSFRPFCRYVTEQEPFSFPRGIKEIKHDILTERQTNCINFYSLSKQIDDEMWLRHHPEVTAMLKLMVAEIVKNGKRPADLKEFDLEMLKSNEELDAQIRNYLKLGPDEPYCKIKKPFEEMEITDLLAELDHKVEPLKWLETPLSSPKTQSSSFVSLVTSSMTLPTPEPEPERIPTISEIFYSMVSMTVDKAIYSRVTDAQLKYDTAYVELMKVIEIAMEIPILPIREEISILINEAYTQFIDILDQKAFMLAQIAWERRMRKKLKRSLRRQANFRGYETPPTPKSLPSYHPSYEKPLQRPCRCFPKFTYNRYPKDRFGIYLPRESKISAANITFLSASMERLISDAPKVAESEGEGDKQPAKPTNPPTNT